MMRTAGNSATHKRFSFETRRLMANHEPPLSIRDLADRIGLTYEFIRRLVRGQNLPTRPILMAMARIFDIDPSILDEWVKEDRCAAEFGKDCAALLFDPETKVLLHDLSCLADADRDRVLSVLKGLLEVIRARGDHQQPAHSSVWG
jgi:transcriptional regulator with XRE-family HTH domain